MTTPINDLLGFVDGYVKETEGMPKHECPERDVMKELAAEVRSLTDIRPMSEAPCDEDILVMLPDGSWEIERGDDYKYQRAIGWLPLPTPDREDNGHA